jgi:hypothetical protein
MENENENETSEPNVASGFGEPSLDADPLDPDVDVALDRLLDEAEGIAEPEQINEPIETESSDPIEETTEEVPEMVDPVERESTEQTESTESTNEPESELDPEIAAIERPRNLSEKNQSNWRKLQETASSYKKQAEEAAQLRQKLDEAQQQVKTPDDYDELRRFRAIFDIQNDPEFRSKFEKPISDAKENIYRILKANGASDEVIKSIEENGGPDKIDSKWWKNNAIDKLPLTEAERLKRNLVDVVELKEKQQFEIENATKNADQYYQQKAQQNEEWYHNTTNEIDTYMDQVTKELPWARFKEAPSNATPDQLREVEQHNAAVGSLAEKFNSALWPTSAQDRANVAAAAVFSHVLTEQLRVEQSSKVKMSEQLKKLTEENNRLKSAGKLPRQNVSSPNRVSNSLGDRLKMSSSDAIDAGLDEALG